MISALTGPLLKLAAGIIAVLAVYLYAHHTGYNSGVEHQQSLQLVAVQKATEAAQAEQRARDDITLAAAVAAAKSHIQIETVTRTIIREVPKYVTVETDAKFPLPCGFIRLHDASASGSSPSSIPLAPGELDGSACPVTASEAASIIADNYGTALAWRSQLISWQAWAKQQEAIDE
tara:strand:- start:108 stop:635 length:528 start_codon:yes stop_codon:yes gene_type:complete